MNVETLGQVFTPPEIVDEMLALRRNHGSVLEPSCGDGAFSNRIPSCVAIEYDRAVCPDNALCMDFFDYPVSNLYDTIIGNPPYVKYKNIMPDTKGKLPMELFDKRTNLSLFFIKKCFDHLKPHGELIFIVPREILKATSAIKLNTLLYENGTITNFRETGDDRVFKNACPNCIIFRYEKDNLSHKTNDGKTFSVINGQIIFHSGDCGKTMLKDIADVCVGAVSGKDEIYINEEYGNRDFVCSTTRKDGKTRRMIYNVRIPYLEQFHDVLINRGIKHFTEDNWWKWGRDYPENDKPRIYVNCKTRWNDPFYTHPCKNFDGSVLAIFPKDESTDLNQFAMAMNKIDWESLGFKCGGRYLFSQKSLENVVLPDDFIQK